jgi:type I restriction enzyme S subunit
MSEWQKVKLGDFLEKTSVLGESIGNANELQHLGVSNKLGITITDHKKSKDISKHQYIEKNYFAYNPYRINVGSIGLTPENVVGLVSPAYVVFKTKEHLLLPELLLDFLKSSDGLFQINKLARGTVRKALRFSELCDVEMVIPPIENQQKILKIKQSLQKEIDLLSDEISNQQTYLTQLRQAILQEAIEGKLTADWRVKNPVQKGNPDHDAQALLEKIQVFWKENKTKSRAITNGQYIELLPELNGWIKTDIDSIGIVKIGGTPSRDNFSYWQKDVAWVSSGEVANCEIFDTREYISQEGSNNSAAKVLPCGSVLVAMIGQGKTRGQSAILRINAATNQNVCGIVINHGLINEKYLHYYFLSRYEESRTFAAGGNQPALNGAKIGKFLINLPPLAEQNAIVERVDRLLESVNALELQVQERKSYAQQLMQAVLKEAFAG